MVHNIVAKGNTLCNPQQREIVSSFGDPHWLNFVTLQWLMRAVFWDVSPMQQDEALLFWSLCCVHIRFCLLDVFCSDCL